MLGLICLQHSDHTGPVLSHLTSKSRLDHQAQTSPARTSPQACKTQSLLRDVNCGADMNLQGEDPPPRPQGIEDLLAAMLAARGTQNAEDLATQGDTANAPGSTAGAGDVDTEGAEALQPVEPDMEGACFA